MPLRELESSFQLTRYKKTREYKPKERTNSALRLTAAETHQELQAIINNKYLQDKEKIIYQTSACERLPSHRKCVHPFALFVHFNLR